MKKFLALLFVIIFFFVLMDELSAQKPSRKKKVAILVYDGVYLLDFCGPLEIFNDTMLNDSTNAFEVFLVGPELKSVKSHTNTEIVPQYTIENCPQPDVLIIPGGNLRLAGDSPSVASWIKTTSPKCEITMSVCTGAFILAELGILDGMKATTWYGATSRLQKKYPKIIVESGKRFTDNGKILTTAGVSAGIDGSLHIVSKLFGKEKAKATAKYIEYDFQE